MNIRFFLISLSAAFILCGCENGGKKIVETKDGVIVTTITGDFYKIIGTELYEIKKHEQGYENGYLKNYSKEIPSKNARLLVSLKAKIFNDKTDYVIKVNIAKNSIKDAALTESGLLGIDNGRIDGVSSLIISFDDKDGFESGQDVIEFNAPGWTHIVNSKGEPAYYEFKGMRISEKQRASENTTIDISWTALQ